MPKEPPNKKLKQTDLLSSFQQSRVGQEKQTARDDKSGETSHNAQERMGSITSETARVIKEVTPSESDHALRDVTHKKTMAPSVKKEVEAGASKYLQQEAEEKKHNFRFRLNAETYSVACKTSMIVYEALKTSKFFIIEKDKKRNKPKEILIQRSNRKVSKAAVKTDFPCCLIEDDEILEITFIQKDRKCSTNQQTTADPSLLSKIIKPETLVTFSIEKEGGPTVTRLLKSAALRENVRHVCVFAFKGEKIKTALKRDGRFNDVIFKKHCALFESGTEIKHEFSLPVDDLDRKTFQVVVISDKNQPESQEDDVTLVNTEPNEASDADAAENGPNQNPINTEQEKKQDGNTTKSTNPSTKRYAAKLMDNSEEILQILRDQCGDLWETVKQRENLKNNSQVLKFFREEYHKSVENFLEVKKVKKLMRLSDSVCQIRVGGTAVGTGFLLFDRFILTNAHVIGISSELTPENVTQYTAVFDYQDMDSEVKRIPVKQLIAFCYGKADGGMHLDYALLELVSGDEIAKYLEMDSVEEIAESPKLVSVEEIAQYPKLLSSYSPNPPNRGQICILGHPNKEVKKMDPCIIIERENRQEAAHKHMSENKHLIHVIMEVGAKQNWDFSAYENKFTYNSCFFHGSSGSPVFDEHCNLIGVHTGGYKYKVEGPKTWTVMDYGFTMQPILKTISAQAKIKGLHEIVNALEPYINKSKVSADQQNQTDCEMEDAEES